MSKNVILPVYHTGHSTFQDTQHYCVFTDYCTLAEDLTINVQKVQLIDWVGASSKQICKVSQEQKAASSLSLYKQQTYS
jgi:hypothetical protein